jgi:hypothetical protein
MKNDLSSGLTVLDIKWMKNDQVDEHNISDGCKMTYQVDLHYMSNGWTSYIEWMSMTY